MTEVITFLVFFSFALVGGFLVFYIKKPQANPEPTPVPTTPLADPVPVEPVIDRAGNLEKFAMAQQIFEGWFLPGSTHDGVYYSHGSNSYQHQNPGNCKKSDGTFITFPSYEAGFQYLKDYILHVRNGQHKAYPKGGDTNISEYTHIYTGDKEPAPTNYASAIANALKVFPSAKLRDIV